MTTLHTAVRVTALTVLALVAGGSLSMAAQDGGPGTGGAVRLDQLQRTVGQWRRVLVIGAHPDDEDTELIAILSRGQGITTGYLSLTRGEGGQNLIGNELGVALGVLRSEELVAARRLDGGQQFFTRAFDFGFSKSAAETFRFWPRDSLIKDVVRIIRRFRPQVIVSVFTGTPEDGHGHHQVAGIVARLAFDVAGDPRVFPELEEEEGLGPWQPAKFYRDYRAPEPAIRLEGGVLDPAVGMTLHQIAMRSRSQHRSQDMGRLEDIGPSQARIALEALAPGIIATPMDSMFAGIAVETQSRADIVRFAEIRLIERNVVVDAFVGDDEVAPGQAVPVTVVVWNGGTDTMSTAVQVMGQVGWEAEGRGDCPVVAAPLAPGAVLRCTLPMRVDDRAQPSQPYYLVHGLESAMYTWAGDRANWGLPFDPPLRLSATFRWPDSAQSIVSREITARSLDQGLGEVRRPVTIVPRVLLDISPGRVLWPRHLRSRPFFVTAEAGARDTATVGIRLGVPNGWPVDSGQSLHFTREGERSTPQFRVTVPGSASDGEVSIRAEAITPSDTLRIAARRIAYPHIRPRTIFYIAEARAVVAPVRFPDNVRVGYVRGAADAIPEALAAAGHAVTVLNAAALEGGLLDSLDVLVIGPRAYEIDDALRRAHPRVLEFARAGGTLIIQYQQYQFLRGGFAPLPFTIASPHDRVTDENAPVTLLQPQHPVFRGPNQITQADFSGWVQERGLYFASTWDPAWQPLLASNDVDEAPKHGGLLVTSFGKGTVVYTGLAFFRQLPAAVPGAWRLFANLLAL